MGLAITAGYIAYAAGMSVNSLLTDRTNPRWMICAAMFCCAATHLGIRLLPYLPVMIVLWCINGYVQSAAWPSIVRLTADNLPAEAAGSLSLPFTYGRNNFWFFVDVIGVHDQPEVVIRVDTRDRLPALGGEEIVVAVAVLILLGQEKLEFFL